MTGLPVRFWIFVIVTPLMILSKGLVPLALDAITQVWNLPDQVVIYCLAKGPLFIWSICFILFGLDHLVFPRKALFGGAIQRPAQKIQGNQHPRFKEITISKTEEAYLERTRIGGAVILGFGIVALYLALFTGATAG